MSTQPWQTGVPPIETLKGLSGLEFLTRISDGRLPQPPICGTLGFYLSEVSKGAVVFTMTPGLQHYNPIGTVHGGVMGTLLDSCMSCAIQTLFEPGTTYTTLEYKVNMVRAITEQTGPVRAEGRIISVGRRVGTADGRIVDANGTLLAHGSTTCMIFTP